MTITGRAASVVSPLLLLLLYASCHLAFVSSVPTEWKCRSPPPNYATISSLDVQGSNLKQIDPCEFASSNWTKHLAQECDADCQCKGFNTMGVLKNSTCTFVSPSNISNYCFYLKNKNIDCKPKSPPKYPPPPKFPPPQLVSTGCRVCVNVSVLLKTSVNNQPLTAAACDEAGQYLASSGLIPAPGDFVCATAPHTEVYQGNDASKMDLCAGAFDTAADTYIGSLHSNTYLFFGLLANILTPPPSSGGIDVLVMATASTECGSSWPPVQYLLRT